MGPGVKLGKILPSLQKPPSKTTHFQDTFDHDKGQKSAFSGRCLHWIFWIFSSGFFYVSPGFLCSLVRKSPQNVEKIAQFPGGEKIAESCHVPGCHGFYGPDIFPFPDIPVRIVSPGVCITSVLIQHPHSTFVGGCQISASLLLPLLPWIFPSSSVLVVISELSLSFSLGQKYWNMCVCALLTYFKPSFRDFPETYFRTYHWEL